MLYRRPRPFVTVRTRSIKIELLAFDGHPGVRHRASLAVPRSAVGLLCECRRGDGKNPHAQPCDHSIPTCHGGPSRVRTKSQNTDRRSHKNEGTRGKIEEPTPASTSVKQESRGNSATVHSFGAIESVRY